MASTVQTASESEQTHALGLIDKAKARGFDVRTAIADKGYDGAPLHQG